MVIAFRKWSANFLVLKFVPHTVTFFEAFRFIYVEHLHNLYVNT